jgi:hypothetical protein
MNGWVDGWMDGGWMDGCINERIDASINEGMSD